MPDDDHHPYTPSVALLGGDYGLAQVGQSELLGLIPPDTLIGSQNPASFRRATTLIQAECADMYARVVTIVLTATRRTTLGPPAAFNEGLPIFARVSFGTAGTQSEKQLEVDYLNGTMFNVPGSFLKVDAVLEDSVQDDTQVTMNVGAFLGYLPMGRTRGAQRTIQAGVIAGGGGNIVIPTPHFANRIEIQGALLGATYTVEQFADAAATILLAVATIPAPAPVRSVPLVNATRYVRITNTSGGPADTRATFHLAV